MVRSSQTMPDWEQRGGFRCYRDADILFLEIHGVFSVEDAEQMFELSDSIRLKFGYVLTVFDAKDAKGMTAAARRLVGQRSREENIHGASAVIGASFPIRTLVQLLRNAIRLFGGNQSPIMFCATADEALQWLAEQRPLMQHAAAKSS